jgi:CRP-like cAMP-binding protein
MARDDCSIAETVIRKLERLGALGEDDKAAIRTLRYRCGTVPAGQLLIEEGSRAIECCVLIDGYACRHKTTPSGGRQIVSFHIPGDLLDLQHLQFARTDHNVQAITPATVAWIAMKRYAG